MFSRPRARNRFLSNINPVIVIGLIFFVILLRTTAEPIFPGLFKYWDILLPFIIYFGQRRALAEGLTLTLLTSHLYSLCSSAPIGVFVLYYLSLFVVARILSYVLYANRWFTIMALIVSLSLLGRVFMVPLTYSFGHKGTTFSLWVGWSLVLNAVLGYLVYRCIAWVDKLTFKTPQTNIEIK